MGYLMRSRLKFVIAYLIHGTFDFPSGVAGTFLNAARQIILVALNKLEVGDSKLLTFLFQLALVNFPIS
jgi:hypothetical protein